MLLFATKNEKAIPPKLSTVAKNSTDGCFGFFIPQPSCTAQLRQPVAGYTFAAGRAKSRGFWPNGQILPAGFVRFGKKIHPPGPCPLQKRKAENPAGNHAWP